MYVEMEKATPRITVPMDRMVPTAAITERAHRVCFASLYFVPSPLMHRQRLIFLSFMLSINLQSSFYIALLIMYLNLHAQHANLDSDKKHAGTYSSNPSTLQDTCKVIRLHPTPCQSLHFLKMAANLLKRRSHFPTHRHDMAATYLRQAGSVTPPLFVVM